ncbi:MULTISPECIES: hypothetical protein [unclassified Pseudomonas]|uniref:hypothetical protein n=1 Tax=unclassified Pseudomonas TaxID=196821 RepID=UPI002AC9345C|nr:MULTISPECIES: hypothetical protein [unclassified Pseudomonas]MEB0048347.1 hypothetical protein [Pseudomonas sp. Dout3]MEB0099000.1 hypothetical protein [Pseudomonas sp. DC1.2]WPX60413.1 hypothetical protein RHM68_07195 [Pseudomonas sp. DC1.2]
MTILNISPIDLSRIVEKLSEVVDFKSDLPSKVFFESGLVFWFFERPLLAFIEVVSGLISKSISSYGMNVFVKFSGDELLDNSCIIFDGCDTENKILIVNDEYVDFLGGEVGYPIVLFNETHDWVAFESAHEEFGVIAVREASLPKDFSEYLESNFISAKILDELALSTTADGLIARAFKKSYSS